jgi:hypothetical protein
MLEAAAGAWTLFRRLPQQLRTEAGLTQEELAKARVSLPPADGGPIRVVPYEKSTSWAELTATGNQPVCSQPGNGRCTEAALLERRMPDRHCLAMCLIRRSCVRIDQGSDGRMAAHLVQAAAAGRPRCCRLGYPAGR